MVEYTENEIEILIKIIEERIDNVRKEIKENIAIGGYEESFLNLIDIEVKLNKNLDYLSEMFNSISEKNAYNEIENMDITKNEIDNLIPSIGYSDIEVELINKIIEAKNGKLPAIQISTKMRNACSCILEKNINEKMQTIVFDLQKLKQLNQNEKLSNEIVEHLKEFLGIKPPSQKPIG